MLLYVSMPNKAMLLTTIFVLIAWFMRWIRKEGCDPVAMIWFWALFGGVFSLMMADARQLFDPVVSGFTLEWIALLLAFMLFPLAIIRELQLNDKL